MLLDSALRIRPTSVLDAAFAIAPVITGIVCAVLWLVDYFHLSLYQLNALVMLTATGIVEFTTTLWVRNVVLQRGVAVLPGGGSSQ
jgi:ABC-type sulfate transport system permease subunit